eukprot:Awhi_evm1s10861
MALVRTCLNEIYSIYPKVRLENHSDVGLWSVSHDCVTGARYNCQPFSDNCPICSDHSFCDFSRTEKLPINSEYEHNEVTIEMDFGNLTGVDISNWNLVGEGHDDNNRLNDWGFEETKKLSVFKASNCSMPFLTHMVEQVIINNDLETLDISNNPLDCCKLSLLYPFPASEFSPYTCSSEESLESFLINSVDQDPFVVGKCGCSVASKNQCINHCPEHTFSDDRNKCEVPSIRSCLSTIYSIYPEMPTENSSDIGLWNVIDNCYPGARYRCNPFIDKCPLCSDNTYCDFSRHTKLDASAHQGVDEITTMMDFTLLTGLDISNWNLIGDNLDGDNRLDYWGLENVTGLLSLRAVNCSMTILSDVVIDILNNNKDTLVNLDVSSNPLDCCKIYQLFPFPAGRFSPYTCVSPVTSEFIFIENEFINPFDQGRCDCSSADKARCLSDLYLTITVDKSNPSNYRHKKYALYCSNYFYNETENACQICPIGSECLKGYLLRECDFEQGLVGIAKGENCLQNTYRSCLNQIFYIPGETGVIPSADPNLHVTLASANCTESCGEHITSCSKLCTSSTVCDLSLREATSVSVVFLLENYPTLLGLDITGATSLDISNRPLQGLRPFRDNNRLSHWEIDRLKTLKYFIAVNCYMTYLTDMVINTINANELEVLDISDNPLKCCSLTFIYPYPAKTFTPYSCIRFLSGQQTFIDSPRDDPFLIGECSCSLADENACVSANCNGFEFDHDSLQCNECPAGYLCIGGQRTKCQSGTYALRGSNNCKKCGLKSPGCRVVGECDVETGEALQCPPGECEFGWYSSNNTCVQQTCQLTENDKTLTSVLIEGRNFSINFNLNLTTFSEAQESIACPRDMYGSIYRVCGARLNGAVSFEGSSYIVSECKTCTPIEKCMDITCESEYDSICFECESNYYYLNDNRTRCLPCISNVTNCKYAACSEGFNMTKTASCIACLDGFYFMKQEDN